MDKELWKDGAIMHIIEEYSQITKLDIGVVFNDMFRMKLPEWEMTMRVERLRDRNLVSVSYIYVEGSLVKVFKPKKAGQERPEVALNRDVVATTADIKKMYEAWAKKAGLDGPVATKPKSKPKPKPKLVKSKSPKWSLLNEPKKKTLTVIER